MKLLRAPSIFLAALLVFSGIVSSQEWAPLNRQPIFLTDTALLLTDGTVMMHEDLSPNWWRLTPDNTGSYLNGTWSPLASMPPDYGPNDFASAVLADGRALVEGGEHNLGGNNETPLGAIYDPTTNTWTNVNPPSGWSEIGDSPAVVLSDGTFMLGQRSSAATAFFNAKALTWTLKGTGKQDYSNEEGFNLLPDGTVLVVDTGKVPYAERYIPSLDKWISAGQTPQPLVDTYSEIGPGLLRPDGTTFYMGASSHTAIYTPQAQFTQRGKWKAGPDFPDGNGMGDMPAAVLPDGNVLCDTFRNGGFPLHFYIFDGSKFVKAAAPPGGFNPTAGHMLVLPTGQILFIQSDTFDVELYTAKGTYKSSWAPTVTSAPSTVIRGQTYPISGTQFNGLTAGANYGDDAQMATNYPLVRITNTSTGHVFYARTHDHSSMGVATGKKKVSSHFDVPPDMETGGSKLVVVANGIPSQPVAVNVQ
jgi:hypothetical protein